MYVKLHGGPCNGRTENVIDGCDVIFISDTATDKQYKYVRAPNGREFLYSGARAK